MILFRILSWTFLHFLSFVLVCPSYSEAKKLRFKFEPSLTLENNQTRRSDGYYLHYDIIPIDAQCALGENKLPAHRIDLGDKTSWDQDDTLRPGYRYIFVLSAYITETRYGDNGIKLESRLTGSPGKEVFCFIVPGDEPLDGPLLSPSESQDGFSSLGRESDELNHLAAGEFVDVAVTLPPSLPSVMPSRFASVSSEKLHIPLGKNLGKEFDIVRGDLIPSSAAGAVQNSVTKKRAWNPLVNAAHADTFSAVENGHGTTDVFESRVIKKISKIAKVVFLLLAMGLIILFKDALITWAKFNLEKAANLKFRRSK